MIACTEVGVEVGGCALLRGVSLSASEGEMLALTGPNGAGKSTLLRVLSGDRAPDRGVARLLGKDVRSYRVRDLARARAVLPQHDSLSFPFTALEVVLIGRAPHVRVSETEEDFRVAREALRLVGMTAFSERLYTTLSGGERQRVQLARALAQLGLDGGARVLLMDEPTSALDLSHQHKVLELARAIARGGAAVVVVLHDLNLAARYCDRVAVLGKGELRALGSPSDVLTERLLEEVFHVRARVLEDALVPSRVILAVDRAMP